VFLTVEDQYIMDGTGVPISVNQMAVMFTTNKVVVQPKCKFLQRSLGGGMFNKNRTDFERTKELGHMDALAALMYAFRTQNVENPYTPQSDVWLNVYVPPKQEDSEYAEITEAMNPRGFGRFKF